MPAPEIPDEVQIGQLDRSVRARLRGLSKENAEGVGRHLVMVARLLDVDPELAYLHAQAAVRRGGRVDVVREAAGLAAYRTERYAEALRELRTVRRLNGSSEHLPVMADCERGLGRPERAIALAAEPEAQSLDPEACVELAMVVSGARLDLGEAEAAVAVLDTPLVRSATGVTAVRVASARAAALEAAGRGADAHAELARYTPEQLAEAVGDVEIEDEIVVFDLDEGEPEQDEPQQGEPDDHQGGAPAADAIVGSGPRDSGAGESEPLESQSRGSGGGEPGAESDPARDAGPTDPVADRDEATGTRA